MKHFLLGSLLLYLLASPSVTAPYPAAPLCAAHDETDPHGLWNAELGCHYDHEHGDDPAQIQAIFGVDYLAYTGQGISYPWHTGGEVGEHVQGFKWTVRATNEDHCVAGDTGVNGTNGYAVEYHGLGSGEHHTKRIHSSFAIVRVCNAEHSGLVISGGWQDYGCANSPYQGPALNLPEAPSHTNCAMAPYVSLSCFNDAGSSPDCGTKASTSVATWVSRPQAVAGGHQVFQLLWRTRDPYAQVIGSTRLTTPAFRILCGLTVYNPTGCKFNNTTGAVHQVFGNIPANWDYLDGIQDGLANYTGYTDRWGNIVVNCEAPGLDCVPLVLDGVPIGEFSTTFDNAANAFSPAALPEHDICFKANKLGVVSQVNCDTAGAVPSGWVGADN